MALPALALIPALTWEGVAVATSIGGFFTYLWNKNYEEGKNFNFDFTSTEEFNLINTSYTDFETKLTTVPKTQIETFSSVVKEYENSLPKVQDVSTVINDVNSKVSLIDVIKTSNLEQIKQQQILNNNLSALNNTILKLFEAKNMDLLNQQKQNVILSENLQAINISLLSLATIPKILAEISGSQISHSVENSLIIEKIEEITNAIKSKSTTINANGGVNVSLDTAPIVEALNTISSNQIETNEKIVQGINSQTAVNNKTLEKLNQQLSKDVEIDGVKYNSIDLEKNKNKEVFIGSKDENEILLNDGLELVEEALTDGFDVNINPLAILTDAFAEFVLQDKNELITKFNINDKGVV